MSAAQDNPEGRKVEPDRKLFADELKAMRKQRGWSQEETAARIKFSSATIANNRVDAPRPDP
jgi:ribosome-binding protein aMBF1 (putative translation factor)